jgi:hypothetical protein
MKHNLPRRKFIKKTVLSTLGVGLTLPGLFQSCGPTSSQSGQLFFSISLAQWSLHRKFFGNSLEAGWEAFGKALREDPGSLLQGSIDPLDFPTVAKNEFGIDAVEYVNTFYYDKAENSSYLSQLKDRCER